MSLANFYFLGMAVCFILLFLASFVEVKEYKKEHKFLLDWSTYWFLTTYYSILSWLGVAYLLAMIITRKRRTTNNKLIN